MPPDPRIARTRSKVLRAAYEVLAEVGYEGATIEMLSERSGVSRSTMYRHWDTREAILRDAFTVAALGRDLGAAVPDGSLEASGPELLERYAEAYAHGLEHVWGRVAATMATAALDDAEHRGAVDVFVVGTQRDLGVIVEKARGDGLLRTSSSTERVVEQLVDHLVAPLFYRHQFLGSPATSAEARRLAREAWDFVAEAPLSP